MSIQKAGSQFVHALRDFPGALFPINPTAEEIQGFKAYPDLKSLPVAPDLVGIAVPAAATPSVIRDCVAAGAGGALVIGGGFAEAGDDGAALQAEMLGAARHGDLRVLGPNTSGFFNPGRSCYATFAPGTETIRAGNVAVVAQSGGVNLTLSFMLARAGLGVSLAAGLGNAMDVDAADVLGLLALDDATNVIALHVEGVTHGRRLYDAVRAVTRHKPVVVLTVGRGDSGAFAQSHTGALLGGFEVKVAALRQAGAIVVATSDELVSACMALAFNRLPPLADPGVALVTGQAGPGLLIIDNLKAAGIAVPDLCEASVKHIRTLLPPITYMSNPVDTGRPSPTFGEVLQTVADDPGIDLVCVSALNEPEVLAPAAALGKLLTKKPVLFSGLGAAGAVDRVLENVRSAGFAAFLSPEQMVTGVSALVNDARARHARFTGDGEPARPEIADVGPLTDLDEASAKGVLGLLGIASPRRALCDSRTQAHAALAHFGGKVVVKVVDSAILHKSEVGGVHVGIADAATMDAALERIDAIPGPQRAYMVEEMAASGFELIAGAVRDPSFGPVVLVGMGGVAAEAIQDVSRRLAPIGRSDAKAMLDELKSKALLDGWRGAPAVDREAVISVLVALSDLVVARSELDEIEINPLRAYPDGCLALDALIVARS
jgi:acetyltransferase